MVAPTRAGLHRSRPRAPELVPRLTTAERITSCRRVYTRPCCTSSVACCRALPPYRRPQACEASGSSECTSNTDLCQVHRAVEDRDGAQSLGEIGVLHDSQFIGASAGRIPNSFWLERASGHPSVSSRRASGLPDRSQPPPKMPESTLSKKKRSSIFCNAVFRSRRPRAAAPAAVDQWRGT